MQTLLMKQPYTLTLELCHLLLCDPRSAGYPLQASVSSSDKWVSMGHAQHPRADVYKLPRETQFGGCMWGSTKHQCGSSLQMGLMDQTVKNPGFEVRQPWVGMWTLLAVQPWGSEFTSPCLGFIIHSTDIY